MLLKTVLALAAFVIVIFTIEALLKNFRHSKSAKGFHGDGSSSCFDMGNAANSSPGADVSGLAAPGHPYEQHSAPEFSAHGGGFSGHGGDFGGGGGFDGGGSGHGH